MSTVVISPEHFAPMPSSSAAMQTPENTEGDTDNPEPTYEGDIQMKYSCD